MKIKKIISSLVLGATVVSLAGTTVFAGSVSNRWTTPCHTFVGCLNSKPGYIGEASTKIEGPTGGKNAYVYIEGVDSNGYRIQGSNREALNSPTAYIQNRAYNAAYFNSRHTVKDPGCKNYYFQLSAEK